MTSTLNVAPVSAAAAEYAVTHWHYSHQPPSGKAIRFGVWEDSRFVGVVIFSRGANNNIGRPYGLQQQHVVELTRVALRDHQHAVSEIIARALRVIKTTNPGLRLILSYADPEQGHHGGIYQAGNWLYLGRSKAQANLIINGTEVHKRTAAVRYGTASPHQITARTGLPAQWGPPRWKHIYVMPLDKQTRRRLQSQAQPYPSRAV